MKKFIPQPVQEIKYLEESTTSTNSQLTPEQQTIIDSFASKDTYFVLSSAQFEKLKLISETIFRLTNETLLDTVKQKDLEPWIEARYGIVKELWHNGQTGVNLMRIDFAWDQEGNFKILELNTASHSGWILSGLTEQAVSAKKVGLPLAPESMFYAKYLLEKLGPRVAIIVIRKDYKAWYRELNWLPAQIEALGGKCQVICLSETGIQELINFKPSGIFWKSNSRLVEHSELVLKVANLGFPQLPSFAALFIAGDKAFLDTLKNKDTSGAIPQTYVLSKSDLAKNFNLLAKDKAVLKPGDLSRGEGIKFGKHFDEEAWKTEIKATANSREEWVMQELCYLQSTKDGRYEDITVFLADGLVQGVTSRISESEVINVSKGGLLQSVVLNYDEVKN
jgi:hypothetical protein